MFSVGARSEFLLHMAGLSCEQLRRRPGRMAAVPAKVKGWEIIDGEEESLADPERGGGWVRFVVGIDEGPGDESFDVLVCAPRWLKERISQDGPVLGRHILVTCQLELREAVAFLTRRFEEELADDWASLGERLSQLGSWEFENY